MFSACKQILYLYLYIFRLQGTSSFSAVAVIQTVAVLAVISAVQAVTSTTTTATVVVRHSNNLHFASCDVFVVVL